MRVANPPSEHRTHVNGNHSAWIKFSNSLKLANTFSPPRLLTICSTFEHALDSYSIQPHRFFLTHTSPSAPLGQMTSAGVSYPNLWARAEESVHDGLPGVFIDTCLEELLSELRAHKGDSYLQRVLEDHRSLANVNKTLIKLYFPRSLFAGPAAEDASPAVFSQALWGKKIGVMVFIHGFGGNKEEWREQMPGCVHTVSDAENQYVGVAISFFGSELSRRDSATHSMRLAARQAVDVCGCLGLYSKKILVVGHSMGGKAALYFPIVAARLNAIAKNESKTVPFNFSRIGILSLTPMVNNNPSHLLYFQTLSGMLIKALVMRFPSLYTMIMQKILPKFIKRLIMYATFNIQSLSFRPYRSPFGFFSPLFPLRVTLFIYIILRFTSSVYDNCLVSADPSVLLLLPAL